MRSYPTDSPQAVARVVALALLADGNLHPRELGALQRMQFNQAASLPEGTLQTVLRDFCEDLLATHPAAPASTLTLDDTTIASLLDEVQDESLRIRLLQLCVAVIEAAPIWREASSMSCMPPRGAGTSPSIGSTCCARWMPRTLDA